jgi:hypothetical protein
MRCWFRWELLPLLTLVIVGCESGERARAPSRSKPSGGNAIGVTQGFIAPEIDGYDTDGRPMKLSQFRGKVVLLDFWRTD